MMTSKVPHKPEGYQSVIPYIHANGAAKLIAFMKEVFEAKEIAVYPRPDGTVGHAALRIGDSVVELADGGRTGLRCPAPCRCTFPTPMQPTIARSKPAPSHYRNRPTSSMVIVWPACGTSAATIGISPRRLR